MGTKIVKVICQDIVVPDAMHGRSQARALPSTVIPAKANPGFAMAGIHKEINLTNPCRPGIE